MTQNRNPSTPNHPMPASEAAPIYRKRRHTEGEIQSVLATKHAGDPTPVWYGTCGHWTAHWSKLRGSGVPLCPLDGAPGFHAEVTWWADVDAYEADGHPGYRAEVEALELP